MPNISIVLAAALALGSTATGAAPATLFPEQLEAIFASACFDGAVTLNSGEASPITLDQLPRNLRRRFGKSAQARVWKLESDAPAYLYVLNFSPTAKTSPVICGLAAQSIEIAPAIQFVGARVNGPSLESFHEPFAGAEWLNLDAGYVAVASKADTFTVLEVKQLTRKQRERLRHKQPVALPPPSP